MGELRSRLLAWYRANRRDLPWRAADGQRPDPYSVWLSEVMLQQTRVETVLRYYERWLERFPTLSALASASLDDVLKAWEGLGYYSRARNFHRAAREVVARHAGEVPDDVAAFGALPGVGAYTRGAVASIAFGREEPVVDGNVRRVLARLADEPDPSAETQWRTAAELVRGDAPGDLNQALMELGATVCTPRNPLCPSCPVRAFCAAFVNGTQADRPARKKQKPLPHEDTAVAVIERGGKLLLVRRRADVRLGGLWAFPFVVRRADEPLAEAAERAAREGVGLHVRAGAAIASVEHTFTHVHATYHAVRCTANGAEPEPLAYDAVAWAAPEEAGGYALPVAQQKIAALAAAHLASS